MIFRQPYIELGRDFIAVLFLASVSLAAALAINRMRSTPLPLIYQAPDQRLAAELTKLVESPAFRLSDFNTIGLDEFRGIALGRQALVFDAREGSFYQAGHIPGALNLSRHDFAHDYARLRAILEHSKDQPVVVYCSGGECHDSRLVASALLSLGFTQVRIFTGGWTAWTQAGEPISR
jgi:rhodanese-related sulfurtransferase